MDGGGVLRALHGAGADRANGQAARENGRREQAPSSCNTLCELELTSTPDFVVKLGPLRGKSEGVTIFIHTVADNKNVEGWRITKSAVCTLF